MGKEVKISFRTLVEGEDFVESAWAVEIDDHLYRLENSLFYAYELSWKDIVSAFPNEDGELEYSKTVMKSGHRTVRINLDPPPDQDEESQEILDSLKDLDCTYEEANPTYFAIDIPPEVFLNDIIDFLKESGIHWENADPKR